MLMDFGMMTATMVTPRRVRRGKWCMTANCATLQPSRGANRGFPSLRRGWGRGQDAVQHRWSIASAVICPSASSAGLAPECCSTNRIIITSKVPGDCLLTRRWASTLRLKPNAAKNLCHPLEALKPPSYHHCTAAAAATQFCSFWAK